ncbi:hypothetical protein GOARA_065_00150 [Gordonia araii NBRC 100433]|uniref:Uncharacterized protein n=1 Tax=Gordonia araii NBRC 100433 TaxID=1073574 RepID=G7H5U7_9ACTN|nr:hypothetical protein [Gordonia araii]NNG95702.1 hypothetical protein [Gordonia araii NBRC 100433]GAB11222.1 hypothetical protein GOARA_065_00150 [Gordonia araii NBRC 100433]
MTTSVEAVAGDECVCVCHRDPSVRHAVACCADCAECGTRVQTAALATHQPARCSGFRSGRLALRADAIVCVLAGAALLVLGGVNPVMPAVLHVILGVALAVWGVGLWFAPSRWPLRAVLAAVTAANLGATVALVVAGIAIRSDGALRWMVLLAAVVVVLFAVWEWVALRQTQASGGFE